jgi:hypothetical protein
VLRKSDQTSLVSLAVCSGDSEMLTDDSCSNLVAIAPARLDRACRGVVRFDVRDVEKVFLSEKMRVVENECAPKGASNRHSITQPFRVKARPVGRGARMFWAELARVITRQSGASPLV